MCPLALFRFFACSSCCSRCWQPSLAQPCRTAKSLRKWYPDHRQRHVRSQILPKLSLVLVCLRDVRSIFPRRYTTRFTDANETSSAEATLTEARLPAAQGFKQRDEVPPWGETVYFSTIVYYSSGTTIYESGTASGSLPIMSPPSWVFSPSEHSSLSSTQSFPPSPSASGTSDAFSLTSSSQIASSSTTPRGFSSSSSVAAYTSSQGTVPSSTTTQLYSPGVSSVSRYTTQKSVLPSPSLRSTAAVSDRHSSGGASATSATSAPKSAARVVPLRLVLAIVVTVLAVLMLGALGVYARRRWRTRLATKERIAGEHTCVGWYCIFTDAFLLECRTFL